MNSFLRCGAQRRLEIVSLGDRLKVESLNSQIDLIYLVAHFGAPVNFSEFTPGKRFLVKWKSLVQGYQAGAC
jgi:hypothetical protein